jgi:hypothetical protein
VRCISVAIIALKGIRIRRLDVVADLTMSIKVAAPFTTTIPIPVSPVWGLMQEAGEIKKAPFQGLAKKTPEILTAE